MFAEQRGASSSTGRLERTGSLVMSTRKLARAPVPRKKRGVGLLLVCILDLRISSEKFLGLRAVESYPPIGVSCVKAR